MGTVTYDFSDETVIVTGASSGIGRAIALEFAAADATVLNADLDPEPKDTETTLPTHERIADEGGTAAFVETDVSNPAEIRELVAEARSFGGVDVMVNNAGLYIGGPMRDVTEDEFDRIHATNVKGVFFGTQVAANDMIERGVEGTVVNTASISSNLAQFDQVQYDSTKGAIRMVTRGSALELAEHGIRVNAVAPGQIATEFLDGWTAEAKAGANEDSFIKPVPLGRAGVPGDVAPTTTYLASEAAAYITGETVHVDGGWQIL
jgi:NAD(P)-dependent dehydrogenase (short-subunit alcohol dehydrogenase family)